MTTSIAVTTTTRQVEKRDWLYDAQYHQQITGTLDTSAFTAADHFPLGYVPSGTALIRAGALWAPAAAGALVEGVLYGSVDMIAAGDDVGCSVMIVGIVTFAKLPKSTDSPARVGASGENGEWGANLAAAHAGLLASGSGSGFHNLIVVA